MIDLKEKILTAVRKKGRMTSGTLAQKLNVSRQTAHKYLTKLVKEELLQRLGSSKKTTVYVLTSSTSSRPEMRLFSFHQIYALKGLEEDRVWRQIASQSRWNVLPSSGAKEILQFAFTEMLNNAIDHSRSDKASVVFEANAKKTSFVIDDKGIGAFETIRREKNLNGELEAIQDLLKGKQTTAPKQHSGEGIFFTSKAADLFILESHRKKLTINNRIPDIFIEDSRFRRGTRVTFEIDHHTSKKLTDIFKTYTNDRFQFNRTQITVRLFQEGEIYVSRSQGKRLLNGLDPFQEIILDFERVKTIGQGFADEIFRIYAEKHPEKKITSINCDENVAFMIKRAGGKILPHP